MHVVANSSGTYDTENSGDNYRDTNGYENNINITIFLDAPALFLTDQ